MGRNQDLVILNVNLQSTVCITKNITHKLRAVSFNKARILLKPKRNPSSSVFQKLHYFQMVLTYLGTMESLVTFSSFQPVHTLASLSKVANTVYTFNFLIRILANTF